MRNDIHVLDTEGHVVVEGTANDSFYLATLQWREGDMSVGVSLTRSAVEKLTGRLTAVLAERVQGNGAAKTEK